MKLKLLWSVCALCATLLAQAGNVTGGPFSIKGSLKGADGKKIYLRYAVGDKDKMDSTVIRKGVFFFKGKLDAPFATGGLVYGNMNDQRSAKWCSLFMEPSAMTVSLTLDKFQSPKVKGSVSQAQYDAMNAQIASASKEMARLHDAVGKEQNIALRNKLSARQDSCEEVINKAQINFIKTHPDSYVAPYLMMFNIGHMTYTDANAAYQAFSPNVKKYGPFIKDIEGELASMKRVQPGEPAPDFTTTDINGNKVSFSDMKGKYVLLDFWASWCVPCRRSFPHVKALYNKYKDAGLDVFCVGDNDNQTDKWREAIKKDGVEMFHHVLRGMKASVVNGNYVMDNTNDISEKYAVHYLPTKYLIDKEGKIVGQFADEQLDAKLKEIFGF
jgi:peroxiredoxin